MPGETYLWALRVSSFGGIAAGALLTGGVRGGRSWTAGALTTALALTLWRTTQVGHLPLAGLHETLLTFGAALVAVSARPCAKEGAWRVFGLCLAAAGLLWGGSSLVSARPTPLVPALQTLWFEVHVTASFLGYGCFGLAAAAGALHLAGFRELALLRLLRRANAWGFAWFTWAMVSGGIWAHLAWGTYWFWHVKELWSGIVWTYYAGLVHVPHLRGWGGFRESALSLIGLALVLFTYLGVGLLMRNTHQFSP